VTDPVADAESAELGEIAVVEDQAEIRDLGFALRIDRGDAARPGRHIGPLRGVAVPMQFAKPARRELHQHARDLLRNRKFGDRRLLRPAAIPGLGRARTERKPERRQFLSSQQLGARTGRSRRLAGRLGGGERGQHAAGGTSQNMSSRKIGHGGLRPCEGL
jgi:hypothetical protein